MMHTLKNGMVGIMVLLLASCATTEKFPVSEVLPAADITVKTKQDKHNNSKITVKAKNLASPERLNPSKSFYVVWVESDEGIKNVGQLTNKNARKAELETLTPFEVNAIFITAEERGDISYPVGMEISRVTYDNIE